MDKRTFIKKAVTGIGCSFVPFKTGIVKSAGFNGLFALEEGKHTIEAMYNTVTPKGLKCLICPNECELKEGESGDCQSRVNRGGKLYSIAYGNPCAVHVDPIEKKPLFHFYPASTAYSIATAGCNLACLNCQNWSISQISPEKTRNYDLMPEKVVKEASLNKCKSIAYTYSEPVTFYEYTLHTSQKAREEGIKNVLVTAGYIHEKPLRNLCKTIDAANVDLKSFENDIYLKLNGGKLQPVLDSLRILADEGVWLEITNLIIPGWTDSMEMIKKMCAWLVENNLENYPLHFSRFHPQYKLDQVPPTPVSTLIKARETALAEGIRFVYIGNVPGNEAENTFCPKCKKVVVERKGYKVDTFGVKDGKCIYCQEEIPGFWKN